MLVVPSFAVQAQPITVYCHGVGADKDQISDYKDQIAQPCVSFNFPDTQAPTKRRNKFIAIQCEKIGRKYINREQMYMGQGKDVQALQEQIKSDESYILFGLCRGGMAIINYMAQHNPDNICALVLDETPADVCDIIKKMQNHCKPLKLFSTQTIMHRCFPACRKNFKAPVHNIASIKNKELPIFLVYANKNTTFHFPSSTWKNYLAFKKAGFKNVYLCELKDSCQKAVGADKLLYLQALNSFYKHHNLAYNPKYAVFNDAQLADMQPSIATIQQRLDANKDLEKATKKNKHKNQQNMCAC
jgi:pimeloyl-ACP methyl ester carboxylesterase